MWVAQERIVPGSKAMRMHWPQEQVTSIPTIMSPARIGSTVGPPAAGGGVTGAGDGLAGPGTAMRCACEPTRTSCAEITEGAAGADLSELGMTISIGHSRSAAPHSVPAAFVEGQRLGLILGGFHSGAKVFAQLEQGGRQQSRDARFGQANNGADFLQAQVVAVVEGQQ